MRITAFAGAAILIGASAMSAICATPQTRGSAPSRLSTQDSWRVWGGPGRDFIAAGTGVLPRTGDKWLATPPRKLWERALGDGYSAIAVEDGILYTGYRKGDNDVIAALEAATGRTVWEYSYAAPFKNSYSAGVGPGPYAMPQIVGDRIVTASGIGLIQSVDKKTGRPIWSWDLYKQGGTPLGFGYSSHALPYKDSLILLAGGSGNAVIRVRQTDGSAVWQKLKLQAAHSSPLLIDVDGQPQVAILLANEIVGIDPESGDLLWRHPHKTEGGLAVSTPVWAPGNLLFLSTAYGGGARVLKLTRSGATTAVQELWSNAKLQAHFGSVVRQGGFVYLSSGQSVGILTAVELQTGRVAWQVRDFVKAQLLGVDGRLLILDEDGYLGLGVASPERFQTIAKWPMLASVAWTPPTLAGTRLYLRDRRVIMALDLTAIR
jgi:outer membrane protein assembly factor BamB